MMGKVTKRASICIDCLPTLIIMCGRTCHQCVVNVHWDTLRSIFGTIVHELGLWLSRMSAGETHRCPKHMVAKRDGNRHHNHGNLVNQLSAISAYPEVMSHVKDSDMNNSFTSSQHLTNKSHQIHIKR